MSVVALLVVPLLWPGAWRGNLDVKELLNLAWMCSLVAAMLIDFVWLVACRFSTAAARQLPSVVPNLAVICAGLAVTSVTFLALPVPGPQLATYLVDAFLSRKHSVAFAFFVFYLSSTRLFIAAVSLLQLSILVAALGHRVFWPLLARIVYGLERHELFKKRPLFATCGIGLLLAAFADVKWLAAILTFLKGSAAG
jgi:hypothetical protein